METVTLTERKQKPPKHHTKFKYTENWSAVCVNTNDKKVKPKIVAMYTYFKKKSVPAFLHCNRSQIYTH